MLAEVQRSFVCEWVGCTGSIQIEQATAKKKKNPKAQLQESFDGSTFKTSRFNAMKRLFVLYMHV